MAAEAAWPEALAELVGTECFAECLAALEIASLADLAETVDLEEGHDATMRAVIREQPRLWPDAKRPLQPIDVEYLACECRKYGALRPAASGCVSNPSPR